MWRTGRGTQSTATMQRPASRSSGSGLLSRSPIQQFFQFTTYYFKGNGQRDTIKTAAVCLRHLQVNPPIFSPKTSSKYFRVPVGGFGELMGSNGPQRFCIEKVGCCDKFTNLLNVDLLDSNNKKNSEIKNVSMLHQNEGHFPHHQSICRKPSLWAGMD